MHWHLNCHGELDALKAALPLVLMAGTAALAWGRQLLARMKAALVGRLR